MTRIRLFRVRRPADPELEQAKRDTAASRERSEREYRKSMRRLADTQQVVQELRHHNASNHYGDWLESVIARGSR